MKNVIVNGREFAIEFEWASQGHRLTVMEWDGDNWQTLPDYNGVLHIGTTQFESLCHLSNDLFDEAVHGETFAELLEIPMITDEDAECLKCGTWQHYSEMVGGDAMLDEIAEQLGAGNWDYACIPCYEELAVKVGA